MIKKNFNNYNYRSLDLSTLGMKDTTSFCLLTCLSTARHGTNKSIFTFSNTNPRLVSPAIRLSERYTSLVIYRLSGKNPTALILLAKTNTNLVCRRSFSASPSSLAPLNQNKKIFYKFGLVFSKNNLLKHMTLKNISWGLFTIFITTSIRYSGFVSYILILVVGYSVEWVC